MPNKATVFRWLAAHEAFSDQYAHARDSQADTLFDDVLAIADQYDTLSEALNPDLIQRAKLRIDARKWMAGKLRPKKYGDKLELDASLTHEAGDSISSLMERIANNGKRIHSD